MARERERQRERESDDFVLSDSQMISVTRRDSRDEMRERERREREKVDR